MADPDRRESSLDLTEEDLRALLAGVMALGERELAATRSGPVFERPPSAAEVDRVIGADRALPVDGGSIDALLAECAPDAVTADGWHAIDALERERGREAGRPRVKLASRDELVVAAGQAAGAAAG
jgi:hypothetical protein